MKNQKRKIAERIVRLKGDDRSFDIEFWQQAGPEAIFAAAWQMVLDMYAIRGKNDFKPRFQRSVEKLERIQR